MPAPRPVGGQVVVITGAARGLGAALAEELAGRGARLALIGLEPEMLAEIAGRCGPTAAWWTCDVTDGTALAAVAEQVAAHFGRVDVVVANAGIAVGSTLVAGDPESYDRVVEVNLLGSIRTARAFLPHLAAAHGHLLQISSLAAIAPAPMMGAYAASKAGVEAFAHCLRTEVAHHGVTVGVAYLSFTATDMTTSARSAPGASEVVQRLPGPLGRVQPLAPAVRRIADGLANRSPRVYGQAFIRLMYPWRAFYPAIVFQASRGTLGQAEQAQLDAPESTLAVGPGGAADRAARERA